MLSEINNAKLNARGNQIAALQQLQTGILQQAYNELSSVKAEAAQNRQAVQQWVMDRAGQLATMQGSITSAAQYTPEQLQYQQLKGGQVTPQQTSGFEFSPYGLKKDPKTGG